MNTGGSTKCHHSPDLKIVSRGKQTSRFTGRTAETRGSDQDYADPNTLFFFPGIGAGTGGYPGVSLLL